MLRLYKSISKTLYLDSMNPCGEIPVPEGVPIQGLWKPPTGKGYSPHPYCQDTLRFTVFSLCKKCIIGMIQKFDQ